MRITSRGRLGCGCGVRTRIEEEFSMSTEGGQADPQRGAKKYGG
jgi:hypothetical protein